MTDIDSVLRLVARDADRAESCRRITTEVLVAMRGAGLLRLCVPKSLGGEELDPLDVVSVIERLAAVDGAAGWCAMISATSGCVSGHLDPDTAEEVFGATDGLVVGPFAPLGTAVPTGSGYTVTGRWPYASMCQDASWIMVGTTMPDRARRLALVPAAEVVVHDTWSVMGLCASGSHDIEIAGAEVPACRSVPLTFDDPRNPGALYRFPVLGLLSSGIAAVGLGLARGAIDHLVELARDKTPTYSVRRLAERPDLQSAVALARTRLDAARGLLNARLTQTWDETRQTGGVGVSARIALRAAAAYAARESVDIVTDMYGHGGGTSIYTTSPAQRRLRDVHTASQHAMVSRGLLEVAGRDLLGLRVDPTQI